MKVRARRFPLVAVFAALVCSCAPVRSSTASPDVRTTLHVDNRAFLDMTIYVVRGSQRVRLGQTAAVSSSTFVIPSGLVFDAMPLRFVADPIGSTRAEITEEIDVRPGDEVVMQIPPA